MKKYFICRAVNRADGSTAAPVESTETRSAAESLFYTRCSQACAAAAAGESLSDCVIFFDQTGFVLDQKGWIGVVPDEQESVEP